MESVFIHKGHSNLFEKTTSSREIKIYREVFEERDGKSFPEMNWIKINIYLTDSIDTKIYNKYSFSEI